MLGILSMSHISLMSGHVLIWPIGFMLLAAAGLMIFAYIAKRRSVEYDATAPGLYGITGRFGSGKSYFLTWMAWLCLKRGRMVFATYELAGFKTFSRWESDHNEWYAANVLRAEQGLAALPPWIGPVLIETSREKGDGLGWMQVIRVPDHCTVIIDEAQGWWPSTTRSVPLDIRMWISTLRHRGITVLWATQWVEAVAKWLRALSFGIWECEHFKMGHRYTLYDPRVIGLKVGTRKHDARIVLRRNPDVMAMYDTHNTATVARMNTAGPLQQAGMTAGGLLPDSDYDAPEDDPTYTAELPDTTTVATFFTPTAVLADSNRAESGATLTDPTTFRSLY